MYLQPKWVIYPVAILTIILLCLVIPVAAENGTVTIAYHGSGGAYIGDSVLFDGRNLLGNTTVIKVTGPGLTPDGLPPFDLTGTPGSGNTALVNDNGMWFFSWDTGRVVGGNALQTARYTLTAYDKDHPETTTTTSVMLKKPEFDISITPNPSEKGEYVQLTGNAETGISYVVMEIMDPTGKVLHTFMAPVSASGYFQYGFHVDMQPGQYTLKGSNPGMTKVVYETLSVILPPTPTISPAATSSLQPGANETTVSIVDTTAMTPATNMSQPLMDAGAISISSTPSDAEVYLDSVMVGKTPVTLNNIAPGSHTIKIIAEGYMPYSVDVTVKTGEPITVSPSLIRGPSKVPLSPFSAIAGFMGALVISLYAGKRAFK